MPIHLDIEPEPRSFCSGFSILRKQGRRTRFSGSCRPQQTGAPPPQGGVRRPTDFPTPR